MTFTYLDIHFVLFSGYNFVRIVAGYVSPISVVMPSKLLSAAIIWLAPKLLGNSAPAVLTDYQIISNQGLDFGILPIGKNISASKKLN